MYFFVKSSLWNAWKGILVDEWRNNFSKCQSYDWIHIPYMYWDVLYLLLLWWWYFVYFNVFMMMFWSYKSDCHHFVWIKCVKMLFFMMGTKSIVAEWGITWAPTCKMCSHMSSNMQDVLQCARCALTWAPTCKMCSLSI